METVNFEGFLDTIGPSFCYQAIQIIQMWLFMTPFTLVSFIYVFTGYEPPHVCAPTNETDLLTKYSLLNDTTAKVVYEMCQIRITSNKTGHPEDVTSTGCISGHSYEGGKDVSMKTEWDLVCERRGVAELSQTMLLLGMVVGAMFAIILADKYGRKYVTIVCTILTVALEVGATFSPSIYLTITLKFLCGAVSLSLGVVPFIAGAELLVFRQRQAYAIAIMVYWSSVVLLLGLIAYALRLHSWRDLQLTTALIGLIPIMFVYFFDESMAWLFAQDRQRDILKILKRACKLNGTDYSAAKGALSECIGRVKRRQGSEEIVALDSKSSTDYKTSLVLRNRTLRRITLVLCLTWFTCNMTYYGVYLTASSLSGERFSIFLILAATEIPGHLTILAMMYFVGRRVIVVSFMTMSAVFLLISTCLAATGTKGGQASQASTAFFILGKIAISACYSAIFVFTPELYPTTLRSTGTGLSASVCRIGGMLSPFFSPLFQIAPWAPGTILTVLCFFSMFSYLLIPETRGKALPICIEDIESWVKGKRGIKPTTSVENDLDHGVLM